MRLADTRRPDGDDIFSCRHPIQSYQFSDDTRIQRGLEGHIKVVDRGLEGKMCPHLRQFDAIGISLFDFMFKNEIKRFPRSGEFSFQVQDGQAELRSSSAKHSCAVFHPRTFPGRLFIRYTPFQYKSR